MHDQQVPAPGTGPTEAINLLIKKIKRVGHGFRNFTNYRLRLLLHCGTTWDTPATTGEPSNSSRPTQDPGAFASRPDSL